MESVLHYNIFNFGPIHAMLVLINIVFGDVLVPDTTDPFELTVGCILRRRCSVKKC